MEKYIDTCKSIEKILNTVEISWILVNDGSTHNFQREELQKITAALTSFQFMEYEENKGKGYAVRCGAQQVKTPFVIYTDIDFPYKDADLIKIFQNLLAGDDLVLAKRSQQYYQNISKSRTWISLKFKAIVKTLFRIPTTDTQAGLKGLSSKGVEVLLHTTTNRYLFDLELVKTSAKQNLKISEVAVELKEGIVLANVSYRILLTELVNLFKIFWK